MWVFLAGRLKNTSKERKSPRKHWHQSSKHLGRSQRNSECWAWRANFTRKGCPIWICLSSSCRSCARCGFRCCSSGGPLWAMTPRRRPTGRSRRWRTCRRTASAADSSVSAERSGPARRGTKRISSLGKLQLKEAKTKAEHAVLSLPEFDWEVYHTI